MRRDARWWAAAAAVALACGCAPGPGPGGGSPSPSASRTITEPASPTPAPTAPTPSASSATPTPPATPSALPTQPRPTKPPTAPTDPRPDGVVAGRVVAASAVCVQVRTDDDVVWSLTVNRSWGVAAGDTVIADVAPLGDGEQPCGPGEAATASSVRVVE